MNLSVYASFSLLTLFSVYTFSLSYVCLSCVNLKPFQSATYSSWPDPCLTFLGALAAFMVIFVGMSFLLILACHQTYYTWSQFLGSVGYYVTYYVYLPLACHYVLYASISLLYMSEIFCYAWLVSSPQKCPLSIWFPI